MKHNNKDFLKSDAVSLDTLKIHYLSKNLEFLCH